MEEMLRSKICVIVFMSNVVIYNTIGKRLFFGLVVYGLGREILINSLSYGIVVGM